MSTNPPKTAGLSETPKVEAPSAVAKTATRWLVVQMILGVTCLPMITAIYDNYTGSQLPPWVMDTLFVLILCVETMIFIFTAKMVLLLTVAQSAYEDILKLADQVKEPLERMGKMLYDLRDLLPLVAEALSKIDKEEVAELLRKSIKQIEMSKRKMTLGQLEEAADRLARGKK